MQRLKSFEEKRGVLYVVATPIGNLQEITQRAREILEEVDFIACEDTRVTSRLMHHLSISRPLLSCHEHNERAMTGKIIERILSGESAALLSDAGYPLVSDPGAFLVRNAIEKEIPVVPVSGPNAALNALVASGLDGKHALFYGFLDSKKARRRKELETLKTVPWTMTFYEAPHRIAEMLEDCRDVLGNRNMCLARELTKLHEEFIHGTIEDILPLCPSLKGEMVVVMEGYHETVDPDEAMKRVYRLMESGLSGREACRQVAKEMHLSKNQLYGRLLDESSETD